MVTTMMRRSLTQHDILGDNHDICQYVMTISLFTTDILGYTGVSNTSSVHI